MFNCSNPTSAQNLEEYFEDDFKRQKSLQKTIRRGSPDLSAATEPDSVAVTNQNITDLERKRSRINIEDLQLRHSKLVWHGKLAPRLKLPEEVTKEHFKRLCEGRHPVSGEQLIKAVKPRSKTDRKGKEFKTLSRRAGLPQTISSPKSVSLLIPYDERIIPAHQRAAVKALDTVEIFTSVKMGNSKLSQTTGESIRPLFVHLEARPDAQTGFSSLDLHTHCPPLNLGFDGQGKPRALEFREELRSQKLGTAVYRAELVKEMKSLGYAMAINEGTGAPEVVGISREYVEATSTRHREIIKRTQELGIKSTKEVAINYRLSKKFDRRAMDVRRTALDERFGGEAKQTAARALEKIKHKEIEQLKKITAFEKTGTQDNSKTITDANAQKTIETLDFVVASAERRKLEKPEKIWFCRQSLLAEVVTYARFELTIDEILPEFQRRLEQGKLSHILEKREKKSRTERSAEEFDAIKQSENRERKMQTAVNTAVAAEKSETFNEEHEIYVQSTTIESKPIPQSPDTTGNQFSIGLDSSPNSKECAGIDAVNLNDSKIVSVSAGAGNIPTDGKSGAHSNHIDDYSNNKQREYFSGTDRSENSTELTVADRTSAIGDDRHEYTFSGNDSGSEFAERDRGFVEIAAGSEEGDRSSEKQESAIDRRKSTSGFRDRISDGRESVLLNDATRKSEDAERYSLQSCTSQRRSETDYRESTADFAESGNERIENSSVERSGDRANQPFSLQSKSIAADENTCSITGAIEAENTDSSAAAEQFEITASDQHPIKTNSTNFNSSKSGEVAESDRSELESVFANRNFRSSSEQRGETIKASENSHGEPISVQNIAARTNSELPTSSGEFFGELFGRDDEREEFNNVTDESTDVFVPGRSDSGRMGAIYSGSDTQAVGVRDGRYQTARSQGSNESGKSDSIPESDRLSQSNLVNSRNDSDTQHPMACSDDWSGTEPGYGNVEMGAQSADLLTDYSDSLIFISQRNETKTLSGTETHTGKTGIDEQLEYIQSRVTGDDIVFNDSSNISLSLGKLDAGTINVGEDAHYAADYHANCSGLDNRRNENGLLNLDAESRQQFLDSYRRELDIRIDEARAAENQKLMPTNIIELRLTEDRIYAPDFYNGLNSPTVQAISDSVLSPTEQNYVQPLKHTDINQQIAEQNSQNQIYQTANSFRHNQETVEQNQSYIDDEVRQNFITYSHPSDTSNKDDFWKNDRLEREAKIARETAEMVFIMSASELLIYEAEQLEEAAVCERQEESSQGQSM